MGQISEADVIATVHSKIEYFSLFKIKNILLFVWSGAPTKFFCSNAVNLAPHFVSIHHHATTTERAIDLRCQYPTVQLLEVPRQPLGQFLKGPRGHLKQPPHHWKWRTESRRTLLPGFAWHWKKCLSVWKTYTVPLPLIQSVPIHYHLPEWRSMFIVGLVPVVVKVGANPATSNQTIECIPGLVIE